MLERKLNINFRSSNNKTGNMIAGGDWVLESDNINIKDLYFNESISSWSDTFNYSLELDDYNDDGAIKFFTEGLLFIRYFTYIWYTNPPEREVL